MAAGLRKTSDFCWINILTPNTADAGAFFGSLLGWTFESIPQGQLFKVDGRLVGGLFDLHAPNTPPGLPPAIGVMVKVGDANATVERAAALGGRAKAPFDIGDMGRMAECFDPAGAELDIWQPGSNPGTDADASVHGAPGWFELMTSDIDRARAFYEGLFGWTSERVPMGSFDYTLFKLDGVNVAGMMPILPEMGQVPPHWAVYFTVDDVDAAVRRTRELGGSVMMEPHDIAGVGRFAGVVSPQGVRFWVLKVSAMPAPAVG